MNHTTIGPNDVLMGRGGLTNNHPGNLRYRTIVADHQHVYLTARKPEKAGIAGRIVEIVQQNGGRFLSRDASSNWVEIPNNRAREKTSQALREGLDVRNRTTRPNKLARRYGESAVLPASETWKSMMGRQMLIPGWVVNSTPASKLSPAVVSLSGEPVPELREERQSPLEKAAAKMPAQAIGKNSAEQVCEV